MYINWIPYSRRRALSLWLRQVPWHMVSQTSTAAYYLLIEHSSILLTERAQQRITYWASTAAYYLLIDSSGPWILWGPSDQIFKLIFMCLVQRNGKDALTAAKFCYFTNAFFSNANKKNVNLVTKKNELVWIFKRVIHSFIIGGASCPRNCEILSYAWLLLTSSAQCFWLLVQGDWLENSHCYPSFHER